MFSKWLMVEMVKLCVGENLSEIVNFIVKILIKLQRKLNLDYIDENSTLHASINCSVACFLSFFDYEFSTSIDSGQPNSSELFFFFYIQ